MENPDQIRGILAGIFQTIEDRGWHQCKGMGLSVV